MKSASLTKADIEKLASCPAEVRKNTAKHIAGFYKNKKFTKQQSAVVEELFRALLKDDIDVRQALSDAVKDCDAIPKDIINFLCRDIDQIAAPVLENSTVISEKDLISIIKSSGNSKKSVYVSRRSDLSDEISDALIDTKSEEVVNSLIQNKTAKISGSGYKKIVEDHKNKEDVLNNLINRPSTPDNIIIDAIKNTPSDMLYKLSCGNKDIFEKRGISISKSDDGKFQVNIPLGQQEENILTKAREFGVPMDMHITLSLCFGNLDVFYILLSRKLGAEEKNIRSALSKSENLHNVLTKAGLHKNTIGITQALFDIVTEQAKKGVTSPEKISRTLAEPLKKKASDFPDAATFDYFCGLISKICQN